MANNTEDVELREKLSEMIEHDEQWLDEILGNSKEIVTTKYTEPSKWSLTAHRELKEEAKQQILAHIEQEVVKAEREAKIEAYEKAKNYAKGFNDNVINWIDSDITRLKREAKDMLFDEVTTSNCCGAESTDWHEINGVKEGFCPDCKEHCEFETNDEAIEKAKEMI